MATEPAEEDRFADNVADLTDILHRLVVSMYNRGYNVVSPDMFQFIAFIIRSFSRTKLINDFIKKSHMHWGRIKNREREFFIENASDIFDELPAENVKCFAQLFSIRDDAGNFVIGKNKEDEIFDFFEALVKISIKYIHRIRDPYSFTTPDGSIVSRYRHQYFDQVDLAYESHIWNVKLVFPPK